MDSCSSYAFWPLLSCTVLSTCKLFGAAIQGALLSRFTFASLKITNPSASSPSRTSARTSLPVFPLLALLPQGLRAVRGPPVAHSRVATNPMPDPGQSPFVQLVELQEQTILKNSDPMGRCRSRRAASGALTAKLRFKPQPRTHFSDGP